jgi:hypothetical protein
MDVERKDDAPGQDEMSDENFTKIQRAWCHAANIGRIVLALADLRLVVAPRPVVSEFEIQGDWRTPRRQTETLPFGFPTCLFKALKT